MVGGRGSFVIPAQRFEDFARAVVKKLIREIFISGGGGNTPNG